MNFPNWFRVVWWVVLIGAFTAFLIVRVQDLANGNATTFDALVLVLWLALLLVPIFAEVELLGVKLKAVVEEAKNELKAELTTIRTDLRQSVALNSQVTPQIFLDRPPSQPSDEQLAQMENRLRSGVETLLQHYGVTKADIGQEDFTSIPEPARYIIAVRYNLERELRRVWEAFANEDEQRRPAPVTRIVRDLAQTGLLDANAAPVILEVYRVASGAVHGQKVSEAQFEFVQDSAPGIIAALRAIEPLG